MVAKKKTTKKSVKRTKNKKPKYICYDCGTEVIMDCCGVGFRHLICCDKPMKKNK